MLPRLNLHTCREQVQAARASPIRPHSGHTLETEGDSILHRLPYSCLLVGYELRSPPGLVVSSVLERICVTHRSRLAGNTWPMRTWITKPSGKEQVESSATRQVSPLLAKEDRYQECDCQREPPEEAEPQSSQWQSEPHHPKCPTVSATPTLTAEFTARPGC